MIQCMLLGNEIAISLERTQTCHRRLVRKKRILKLLKDFLYILIVVTGSLLLVHHIMVLQHYLTLPGCNN
jgi:hypothetical protein